MSWFLGKKKSTGELLYDAASRGDQEAVSKQWGVAVPSDLEYINEKGSYYTQGFTPLMIAASMGHAPIVKFFMELEGNINHVDRFHGWTPLIEAAGNGHKSVVRLLIDEPSLQVNVQDTVGKTALHWAAQSGRFEIVKMLLSHPRIEVNLKTAEGKIAEDVAVGADVYRLFGVYRNGDPALLDAVVAGSNYPEPLVATTNTTSTPNLTTTSPSEADTSSTTTAALQERINILEKTVLSLTAHLSSAQQALEDHIAHTDKRFADLAATLSNVGSGKGSVYAESEGGKFETDSSVGESGGKYASPQHPGVFP